MYNGTPAPVLTTDRNTDYFEILAGVLQSDTLAPFLFVIVLDYTMRQAIDEKEEKLGFKLDQRRSRQQHPTVITDTDFSDDIALITEDMNQARELLTGVEIESGKIELHVNAKNTEIMHCNQVNLVPVLSKDGSTIKTADNFKYLCAWIRSSGKDFLIRKVLAWLACRLFLATVELVLLYDSKTWNIDKTLCKRLGGCYTKMFRMLMNIPWKQKLTIQQLYGTLPTVSSKVEVA